MPSKDPSQRLRDIAENIEAVESFLAGMDHETFARDKRTLYAVIRALEIISEASRKLPQDLKSRHPDIDWVAIAAAGNVYRHEYDGIDVDLIWRTVKHDVPMIRETVVEELERLNRVS